MKYFTIAELCRSSTAERLGIQNNPSSEIKIALTDLVDKLLDPIRERWQQPITVNSGFRGPILNNKVGGVPTSQHTRGEAADITTGSPSGNRHLFDVIVASGLEFDQLIDEKNYSWLHISYRRGSNRNQILHLK